MGREIQMLFLSGFGKNANGNATGIGTPITTR
jgi:hypothetical protein